MTRRHFLFFILLLTAIDPSFSIDLKSLDKKCLCDVTSQCDNQCCCDSTCDSALVKKWTFFNYCFDDSLGIPFCSSLTSNDINVLDLNSGLRTIYSVIKRLFCVNSVNMVDPTQWYKTPISSSDLNVQLNDAQSAKTQKTLDPNFTALRTFTIIGLPIRAANGGCQPSKTFYTNFQMSSSCRVYVATASSINSSILSISTIQSSLGVTLNAYSSQIISSPSSVSQTLLTSCTGSTCNNIVRELHILINSENGTINSGSYAILGHLTINQAGYININYQYSFVSTISGVLQFPFSSNVGYQFGNKVNILYKDSSSNFYKILNPFNLAFRKMDGSCRTLNIDSSSHSMINLKFGQNQVYSCKGTSNIIYQNVIQIINYLGRFGLSSTTLSDYIAINNASVISSTQSVQLLIYYANIGNPRKTQYEILKAELNAASTKDGLSSLFIQYVSTDNSYSMYVPSPPTVDAYLPNDFLYPFYIV